MFGTAAAIGSTALLFFGSAVANADPAPLPIDNLQAPGLPAMENLSPIIQQAAADPGGAVQLLMAAAQAFAANKSETAESRNVATAVNQFAAQPVAAPEHVPALGAGADAHLPMGVDPAAEQKLPLNVTWVNLTTGKSGSATLQPRSDINPEGPTTLTAIADTGSGSIMSTIFGQVTTTEKQCQFMPTIGSTVVP
nr:hypothetical protein [Mycolicibacterium conceptionense]